MLKNLVQPVKGKTVQRIVLEMDAKGIASIEAKTFDPFGGVTAMNPLFLSSFLAQMLSTVSMDIYSSAMRGVKKEAEDGDKKIITS